MWLDLWHTYIAIMLPYLRITLQPQDDPHIPPGLCQVFSIALEVGYNDGRRMIMGGVALPQPEGEVARPAQVRVDTLHHL